MQYHEDGTVVVTDDWTKLFDTPSTLQTGDEIAIKIVLLQEINGVNTTQVFEWAEYGDSPVSVDSEVISEIERLSQQLTQTP